MSKILYATTRSRVKTFSSNDADEVFESLLAKLVGFRSAKMVETFAVVAVPAVAAKELSGVPSSVRVC